LKARRRHDSLRRRLVRIVQQLGQPELNSASLMITSLGCAEPITATSGLMNLTVVT
jgi:hypothetical protein